MEAFDGMIAAIKDGKGLEIYDALNAILTPVNVTNEMEDFQRLLSIAVVYKDNFIVQLMISRGVKPSEETFKSAFRCLFDNVTDVIGRYSQLSSNTKTRVLNLTKCICDLIIKNMELNESDSFFPVSWQKLDELKCRDFIVVIKFLFFISPKRAMKIAQQIHEKLSYNFPNIYRYIIFANGHA